MTPDDLLELLDERIPSGPPAWTGPKSTNARQPVDVSRNARVTSAAGSSRPCACGTWIVVGHTIEAAVLEHNLEAPHRAWRTREGIE